jgi:hypothetical protein
MPTIYGQGASSAESNLAGRTGIKMLAHFSGYSRFAIALLARCNIAVCEDNNMILDSERANSINATIFGMVRDLNKA